MIQFVLYQPDIAQNVGTMLRLGAALNCPVHIIEPCGFPFSAKALRRSAMDYIDHVQLTTHMDFDAFERYRHDTPGRLCLLTTKAATPYTQISFADDDYLLVGQESAGVPEDIHRLADRRLLIPMAKNTRSLNVAVSLGMVAGEALRQTQQFPVPHAPSAKE